MTDLGSNNEKFNNNTDNQDKNPDNKETEKTSKKTEKYPTKTEGVTFGDSNFCTPGTGNFFGKQPNQDSCR